MSIEELGSLGDLLGSIGVLVTLIYVAIQIRELRSESRAGFLQHRSDAARQLWQRESMDVEFLSRKIKADRALGVEETELLRQVKLETGLEGH